MHDLSKVLFYFTVIADVIKNKKCADLKIHQRDIFIIFANFDCSMVETIVGRESKLEDQKRWYKMAVTQVLLWSPVSDCSVPLSGTHGAVSCAERNENHIRH